MAAKGLLQFGLAVFAAGSLVAAFASDPLVLIVGRATIGLGAAMVFPPAFSVLSVPFPEDERPHAFGIFAAVSAGGVGLGPIIGGLLLDQLWFGSVVLINVPVAVIAIVSLGVLLPPSRR